MSRIPITTKFACLCCVSLPVMCSLVSPAMAQDSEKPWRVALTGKYPPFSYYDNEGKLAGFDVDVSHAIAERLGREVELVATEWDGIA